MKRYGFRNVINPTINNTANTTIITQTQIEILLSFLSSILFTSSLYLWNKCQAKHYVKIDPELSVSRAFLC
jgi:hypothetical protein